ncbi:hypothetical protein HGH93_04355 [Chitinophaga polysaccharea]|uniref:hypothetical protein n=1 Tax=Chitinophaga polysaccharea TaxID=1293035 RepID=UPI0014553E79|nr:hypothetical protein [Chitinophaga polysaccharea]NLR57316.1 hypothetical protein [Chitinophaga polysaccharea]
MGKHLHHLMPCCKDVTMLAEKRLQQEPLTWMQRLGLKFHLLLCVYCRRYVKQTAIMHRQLQEYREAFTAPNEQVKQQWEALVAAYLKNDKDL